jgi:hypothetical protein
MEYSCKWKSDLFDQEFYTFYETRKFITFI